MEEREFLHEMCLTIVYAGKDVKFAGVVDGNGKLIVGDYKKNIRPGFDCSDSINSKENSFSFYANYLVGSLARKFYSEDDKAHFELIQFENVKLAVTPLTDRNDRYLCVFLESSPHYKSTISRISEMI